MSIAPLEGLAGMPAGHGGDILYSCRVMEVEVTVSGHDMAGLPFLDKCNTVAVAANGAIVTIARALALEQEVFLHYKEVELRAHIIGHSGKGNYGVCFDTPAPDFWNGLADFADGTDPLLITSHEQFQQPAPPLQTRMVERRRSARVRMRQAKACIELIDGTQDLAELRDVSRGGLCFCSSRFYPLNSFIRVAAPFTPGSNNLFVDARIVRINRSSLGQDYGAEYIR